MIRLTIAAFAMITAGCGTTYHPVESSTVEYEMLTATGAQLSHGASTPVSPSSTLVASHVSTSSQPRHAARASTSTVRIEPIARHGRSVAPADEDRSDDVDVEPPSEGPWAPDDSVDPGDGPGTPIPGLVKPYSTRRIFRGFGGCRGNRHYHEAIDMGGVGPDGGVGTPVRSMQRARVTFIGRPGDDPAEFGAPERRKGTVVRGKKELPCAGHVDGYGKVYYFTRTKGRWRSGTIIVTQGLGGPLEGHEIRYMHLAAVHPRLKVGSVLEMGEELGLMGGTGVQESAPHVHIDIEDPDGQRVDVAPLLGLPPTAVDCAGTVVRAPAEPATAAAEHDHDHEPAAPAAKVVEAKVWSQAIGAPQCGSPWTREENFSSGRYYAHDVKIALGAGDAVSVALERHSGSWTPRIEVLSLDGAPFYNGSSGTRTGRKRGIVVKRTAGGKTGPKAAAVITAKESVEAIIRVTAWPEQRRGRLLPQDGRYEMTVARRCQ